MKSELKFDQACRCCLADRGHMKNLLQDTIVLANGDSVTLLESFTKCSGIDPDPDATSNICVSCEKKLTNAYDFRKMCHASNLVFERHLAGVKQELQSDEESLAHKKDKQTKRKRPGRPKKTPEIPEIIYMKEETLEKPEPVDVDTIKEESEISVEDGASPEMDHQDLDNGDTHLLKANDTDPDENDSDDGDLDDGDYNSTEADEERKQRALYQCFHCDTYLASYSALAKHKSTEHPAEYLLPIVRTCPVCQIKTKHYTKHIKHEHKDFKPNKCQLCPAGFISHTKLQEHMRVHKTEETHPFKCKSSDCGRAFVNDKGLRHHIKYDKHPRTDQYRCPRCGLNFSEFLPLHAHFKSVHDVQNVKNLFPCYKCKEIYKFRRHILEHSCDESGQKKRSMKKEDKKFKAVTIQPPIAHFHTTFQCPQCSQGFENEDALACHRYTICMDAPKFICVTCGQECTNQRRLTAHKRTHKDMTFICEDCGFQAIDRHTLTKHRMCHSNERPAKCDICNAAFKNSNILNIHKETHGARKFECALCAHKFKTLRNLRLHMNNQHIRPASTFKHECKFCGKMCARNRDLVAHIRSHTGEVIKCQICDRSFRRNSTLKNHIRTVHEGLNLKCVYCNLTFTLKARLNQHLFIHRGFMPFNCSYCSQKFVRKYRFIKHLATHNVEYSEAIHGYQETEDMNAIIAGSLISPARVGTSEIEQAEGFTLNNYPV